MADDSPASRRRALRRAAFVAAGFFVALDAALIVTGELDLALVVTVFGPLMGFAVFDANRCRIKLRRYRDAYGELPPEDDGR